MINQDSAACLINCYNKTLCLLFLPHFYHFDLLCSQCLLLYEFLLRIWGLDPIWVVAHACHVLILNIPRSRDANDLWVSDVHNQLISCKKGIWGFLTFASSSSFKTDLNYKIHATFYTWSCFKTCFPLR